jgi:DNA-binding response OmpR family regulator/EAL domain-containing protein (putative c-di-GMP-specific phosphodiesterase class I)
LSSDQDLGSSLQPILDAHGLGLATFTSRDQLLAGLTSGALHLSSRGFLLVDVAALSGPEALGDLVSTIQVGLGAPLPWACLAARSDIQPRLAAMRCGAKAYLETPIGAEELAERVLELVAVDADSLGRVLVVDDQPIAARFASGVLESAGFTTACVSDALTVLDALESFRPDLVLMDLHMPGASGIELTRLIRDQDCFAEIPIVFLSAELDARIQMAALRFGGDDFLAKPVAAPDLVACVRLALRRARDRARKDMGREAIDPRTGLASLGHLLRRLDRLIQRGATRLADGPQPVLLALELDGDESTLGSLAGALVQKFQAPDLVARVGERSLAVLIRRSMPHETQQQCDALMRDLIPAPGEGPIGVGRCALADGGGDAVTTVSRACKVARLALAAADGRPRAYSETQALGAHLDAPPVVSAVLADRLSLLFEPIVAWLHGSIARYEASPRLETGDGELLPPRAYAPIARQTDLMDRLDRWILNAGLDALVSCHRAGRMTELFIHQSVESLERADWLDRVRDEVNRRGLFQLRPVLQFQVEEVVTSPERVSEGFARLARLGIRTCLNGLSDGSAADLVLERIPATFIRLDRSLLETIDEAPLAALVERAKARNLRVIAGGVDSPERLARLCRTGIDLLQGPFVQPPSPLMDYEFDAI